MSDHQSDKSARRHALVQLVLHDQNTFIEDGAFGDRRVLCAHRHAQELSRLYAKEGFDEADAKAIATSLRERGVDSYRATLVLKACAHLSLASESLAATLISDPDARIRIFAIRAGLYPHARAMHDDLPAVRVAVMQLISGGQCHESWHPLIIQALEDPAVRVRMAGLALVHHLPTWRTTCEQLVNDPDSGVSAKARQKLAARARDSC